MKRKSLLMKRKPTIIIALLALTTATTLHGQMYNGKEAASRWKNALSVRVNETNKSVEQIVFKAKSYTDSEIDAVLKSVFSMRNEDSWQLLRTETDQMGMEHKRFQQFYQGIPVENGIVVVHTKDGFIQSLNGEFFPNLTFSIQPLVSEELGLETVLASKALAKEELKHNEVKLVVFSDRKMSYLAYKYSISAKTKLLNTSVYVDAQTGKIRFENSHVCAADVNGTGHTQFSGIQTVTTNQLSPTQFQTSETGRGNGIQTFDANTSNYYSDNDNVWNNVNANQDEFAMDVHFGAEATYDFYYDNFGRDSYDNAGGIIQSFVNDGSVAVNAYWSGGTDNTMHYGNGDLDYYPVASLEVAGHELTHGVTEYSAGLIYMDESGALNESFSDIFGNTIRFLRAPAVATWYIGDQLLRPGGTGDIAFRNMSNPNEFQNADCYQGLYFNNGDIVHFDSGIQNFWYYLLCQGGSGVNDLGNNYAVTSIGMTDAMKIAYRNLAFYLTPSSTFMDARLGSEQAAIDLFGLCSPQHLEVVHAWYAVGVGTNFSSFEANANFTISDNFDCAVPFTTTFDANPGYEHYSWDFGDGTTSTLENPSHTYTVQGVYNVTLIVYNTVTCPSDDTLTINSAITVQPTLPVANFQIPAAIVGQPTLFTDLSQYNPTSWSWNFGDGGTSTVQNPQHTYTSTGTYSVMLIVTNCAGIDTVVYQVQAGSAYIMCTDAIANRLSGTIYDSGNELGEYSDGENCSILIQPCNASTITLDFELLDLENGWDYLYVHDGNSVNAPVVATITGSTTQAPITSTGGELFVRFESDFSVTAQGFKINYTSTSNGNSGVAAFAVNDLTPVTNQVVAFTDQTTGNPIAWSWNFGDGVTSSMQNPTHSYVTNGSYTVTLIVQFCDNSYDTMTFVLVVGTNGLNEIALNNSTLSVFPVPTTDQLHITSKDGWSNATIQVLDVSGRMILNQVYSGVLNEGVVLNLEGITSGNYILGITFEDDSKQIQTTRTKIQKL